MLDSVRAPVVSPPHPAGRSPRPRPDIAHGRHPVGHRVRAVGARVVDPVVLGRRGREHHVGGAPAAFPVRDARQRGCGARHLLPPAALLDSGFRCVPAVGAAAERARRRRRRFRRGTARGTPGELPGRRAGRVRLRAAAPRDLHGRGDAKLRDERRLRGLADRAAGAGALPARPPVDRVDTVRGPARGIGVHLPLHPAHRGRARA